MERYEVDELLKLTPEEELKISETKKISKTKMDIYYKLGWHMVYISILSIICSYLFSYLFLIITTISLVVFLIANKKYKKHGLNYNISNITNDDFYELLKSLEDDSFDPSDPRNKPHNK
jgi:hypothetical protein